MRRKWSFLIAGAAAAGLIVTGLALAGKARAEGKFSARITTDEAIAAALKKVAGRATIGETEIENGIPLYEVIAVGEDGKTYEVEVNGNTGEIVEIELADLDDEEDSD